MKVIDEINKTSNGDKITLDVSVFTAVPDKKHTALIIPDNMNIKVIQNDVDFGYYANLADTIARLR